MDIAYIYRVPILMRFGEFAWSRGSQTWADLRSAVDPFVSQWVKDHGKKSTSDRALASIANDARTPVQQMLSQVLPGYTGRGRSSRGTMPFSDRAPGFFPYLREERGLRETSIAHYRYYLQLLQTYLSRIALRQLSDISPLALSSFGPKFSRAARLETTEISLFAITELKKTGPFLTLLFEATYLGD